MEVADGICWLYQSSRMKSRPTPPTYDIPTCCHVCSVIEKEESLSELEVITPFKQSFPVDFMILKTAYLLGVPS